MSSDRQQQIVAALGAELERQANAGGATPLRLSGAGNDRLVSVSGQLDLLALATAIDGALGGDTLDAGPAPANVKGPRGAGSSPKEAADQGLAPEELDASNDD
jgi:hypothetical protein